MPRIKYMGTADERIIEKGDNFGGRLADGLTAELKFDRSNNWVVDTDELGLSEDAVALLLEDDGFKDVSNLARVPANEHQKIFLGMRGSEPNEVPAEVEDQANPPGSVADATTGTTAGGSTRGGGRSGGTARGGSTS